MTERLATYLWDAGDEPGALEAAARAVSVAPDEPPSAARALVLASQARLLMLANYNTEALALCEPALDAGRAAAAGQILAGILITQATLIGRSEPRRGLAMLEDARRFAEDIDDVSQMLRADNNLSILLDDLREFDRAQEVMARAIRTAANAGLERTRGAVAYVNAASFALWASQPSRAIELASHAIELTRSGDTLSFAYGARGNAKIHMGELADGILDLAAARQAAPRGATADTVADLVAAEAYALWWEGSFDEAISHLDTAAALDHVGPLLQVIAAVYRAMIQASRAVAARAEGDRDRERSATSSMEDAARSALKLASEEAAGGPIHWRMRLHLALLPGEAARARGAGGSAAWATVAAEEAEMGELFFQAYALWRRAEALVAEGGATLVVEEAIAAARPVAVRAEAGGLLRELDALAS